MIRYVPLVLLLVSACRGEEGDEPPAGELSGCDPIDPALCALPWPSGYFQEPDADNPSGVRNRFSSTALPENRDGFELDPSLINDRDGYATLTPLVVYFEDVSVEGVIGNYDLDAYLAADAKTLIVNAQTGARVPHFVELDMTAPEDERSLILRPVEPMEHGTRYVVGIRGLVTHDGTPVAPSEAFADLRDGRDAAHPDLPLMLPRYEAEIFPVLEDAGVSRSELQLAWDFTTVSRENLLGDILHMRDDAFARMPADGPEYVIDEVELGDCDGGDAIYKTIEGRVMVPRYTDIDMAGAILARGPDGKPAYQADTEPNFLIRIPCSLAANPQTTPLILQYGHGLLGDRGEARTGWLSDLANQERWVVFAMDWTGMSGLDGAAITLMIAQDLSGFRFLPERSQQGFVEFAYGLRMMQTRIVDDPDLSIEGVPLLAGAPIGFYGNSQGGILGGAYTAMSPDLERSVLGVAGMPYSILLSRSADFDPFFLVFKQKYTDFKEITLLLALMQTLWDPGEPSGFANVTHDDPLPGTPPKDVLIQVAMGDAQVTTLGAHVMARAWGASTVTPQTRPVWGVEERDPGTSGSALVEWQYTDVPASPIENTPPPKDFDTHECPRREPAAQAQIRDFLIDGIIQQHCDGPCVSERVDLCD